MNKKASVTIYDSNLRVQPRQSNKMKPTFIIVWIALFSPKLSSSLTAPILNNRKRSLSFRRNFRVEREQMSYIDKKIMSTDDVTQSASNHMPVWLSKKSGENVDKLLSDFNDVLNSRYLSNSEVTQVILAIKNASNGDSKKIAGAIELCTILVEIMDMAVETIIAAAYHYCSCYEVREKNAILHHLSSKPTTTFFAHLWDLRDYCDIGMHNLNTEVAKIVRDTATLKKIEMTASFLMQKMDTKNLRILFLSEARDWRALAIRIAASLYRVRGIIHARSNLVFSPDEIRVAREALHIYAPLASRLGMYRLKNELEGAAFQILYKRQYNKVSQMIQTTKGNNSSGDQTISDNMGSIIQHVTESVTHLLNNDRMLSRYTRKVDVTARVKQPYSLWKKMLKKGVKNVIDVPDALALRIVLHGKKQSLDEDDKITQARERALCYYVRTICTERWKPDILKPRFKDYIERPKKNGYQSLHYSAKTEWEGVDWNLEVQIRSGEMHQVAEYGLAAHWDYKNGNAEQEKENYYQLDHTSDAYLKSVQAWHWQQVGNSPTDTAEKYNFYLNENNVDEIRAERDRLNAERLAPYIEAFSTVQSNLTRNQVLVFLSPTEDSESFDGKIISLPSGSCVMDALREGEKLYGITTNFKGIGVIQNDKETILTQRLNNGDVLKVPIKTKGNMFSL